VTHSTFQCLLPDASSVKGTEQSGLRVGGSGFDRTAPFSPSAGLAAGVAEEGSRVDPTALAELSADGPEEGAEEASDAGGAALGGTVEGVVTPAVEGAAGLTIPAPGAVRDVIARHPIPSASASPTAAPTAYTVPRHPRSPAMTSGPLMGTPVML
jgi:hypothetical protein